MLILGLTGGIACGKSNVSQALHALGADIVDGDLLSRELTAPGGKALPALRAAFGSGIFEQDGTLDRRALGARVFGDPQALATLDAIMQPLLLEKINQRIHDCTAPVCVLDMPLLYEKQLDRLCDAVWCVYVPPETQLARLMERDGFTREEALKRIASQMSAAEKAAKADTVINTSGTPQETRALIPGLFQHLMEGGNAYE